MYYKIIFTRFVIYNFKDRIYIYNHNVSNLFKIVFYATSVRKCLQFIFMLDII